MKKFWLSLMAAGVCVSAVAENSAVFAAHEWGTFTSVQGSDGVQLEWNPFVAAELPGFVYDRARPKGGTNRAGFGLFATKTALVARQRMETPVIYFYAPEEKKVDVHVEFRSGTITEWFPQAELTKDFLDKGKSITWRAVDILPKSVSLPLPAEKQASHYYAARGTEANLLKVEGQPEKFLFYRGVAGFEAPLNVSQDEKGQRLTIRNTGKVDLSHLLVMGGFDHGGKGEESKYEAKIVSSLKPGESREFAMDRAGDWDRFSKEELRASMEKGLIKQGLYAAEAKAMVNTWEDSWLEPGVRVLYMLPKAWTDEILPLSIKPEPQEIARVMVGRAEVIVPYMEQMVDAAIRDFGAKNTALAEMALGRARGFPFARFNDAIVRRLLQKNRDKEYARAAGELLIRCAQLRQEQSVASR